MKRIVGKSRKDEAGDENGVAENCHKSFTSQLDQRSNKECDEAPSSKKNGKYGCLETIKKVNASQDSFAYLLTQCQMLHLPAQWALSGKRQTWRQRGS